MANRTAKDAHSVNGTNPQFLVEKIIRARIYDSKYWKESCFALTGSHECVLSVLCFRPISSVICGCMPLFKFNAVSLTRRPFPSHPA